MKEEITDRIEAYLLHDPIGNVEGIVAEYDAEKLRQAERDGAVFIAVYDSGRREIVKAAEVAEPQPMLNGVVLVKPEFVTERMQAVIGVFDALATDLNLTASNAAPMSISNEDAAAMTATGSNFEAALNHLKGIINGNED